MKKLLIASVIVLAGCAQIKSSIIEYKVRDYLKHVDLNQSLPKEYDMTLAKASLHGENKYPQYIITATLNHGLNIQLPKVVMSKAQQKLASEICENLEKLKEKELDVRQGIVTVATADQVNIEVVIQDKNQHELLRHNQKLTECPNFANLAK